MDGQFPAKTKELTWQKAGNAYVMLDKETGGSFTLDPVSFLIWVQCDGKTSMEEIVDVLTVGTNRDVIKAAVTGVMEKLTTGGLLKWV
jgi:hypothetical protein